MIWSVPRARRLRGSLRVPGDKSISHRSLMFGALASGPSRIQGLLRGEDVLSTRHALTQLGIGFEDEGDAVIVRPSPMCEPGDVLDCGNSGTTIRLLCGLLARQPFLSVLTGDQSLRRRPMARVLDPLRQLGVAAWLLDADKGRSGRDGGEERLRQTSDALPDRGEEACRLREVFSPPRGFRTSERGSPAPLAIARFPPVPAQGGGCCSPGSATAWRRASRHSARSSPSATADGDTGRNE